MNKIYSDNGTLLLGLESEKTQLLDSPVQFSVYTVIFISEGEGIYHADFASFAFKAPVVLFSTPQQCIYIRETKKINSTILQFHGDFYCIEFHRNEVACNGLLFNNIYLEPSVKLTDEQHTFYTQITANIAEELLQREPSEIVLRALLQLFLAKSSSIKMNSSDKMELKKDEKMDDFRILLEENFLTLHKPGDYASLLSITPNSLTKQCNNRFGKTPTQLIQERLILEAKKHLHLTRLSIKEIAFALKFQDEYYFSRVFKKMTKMSPQMFRKTTGISIVADLSKE